MATVADLSPATPESEAAAASAVRAYLKERFPTLPVEGGPAADMVVAPGAAALAAVRTAAELESLSAEEALRAGVDPALLTDKLADEGIVRAEATTAAGDGTLSLPTNTPATLLPTTQLITADGQVYVPDRSYRFYPTGTAATGAADEVVLASYGGRYLGNFGVVATAAGGAGNKPAGTTFAVPQTLPTGTLLYAATDLTGGRDAETADELLVRLADAREPHTTATAAGIRNLVTAAVGAAVDVRVLGFGNPALRRGALAAGVTAAGCADVIVRAPGRAGCTFFDVPATLVATPGGIGEWQVSITAPGLLWPEAAYQLGQQDFGSAYPTTQTGLGVASPTDGHIVRTGSDAAGTPYAALTARFVDPDTPVAGLTVGSSTRTYTVAVRTETCILECQGAFDAPTAAAAGTDVLARAVVPVNLTVVAVTVIAPGGAVVDTAAVAQAYADAVNSGGIGLTLYGTAAAAAAVLAAPPGSRVLTTALAGLLYARDGLLTTLSGTDTLSVTADAPRGLTADTVAYYLDPETVTITAVAG